MSTNAVVSPFRTGRHNHARCVSAALIEAERLCEARGKRLTPLRRRVLALVWQNHRPTKAYDLLDLLRAEHEGAAPPTVYRALEFLMGEGLVHRIESLNAFVGCGDPEHRHACQFLICRDCQAVAELSDPDVDAMLQRKAESAGFRMTTQTIELEGLCPNCAVAG